jgi:glutamyl-tRNA reductase
MGVLAAKALIARGVKRLLLSNRTPQAASDLAAHWGGYVVPFEQLPAALAQADFVVVCTGAPHAIVTVDMVSQAMAMRTGSPQADQPLVLVDIAVPRNVAAGVGDIPNVHVLNLDDLNDRVQDALRERASAVPHVQAIVAEELASFNEWMCEAEALALIADLHRKAEAIRQRELQRTLRYLPDLDPRAQQHIYHLTQSLIDKLLHEPTQRLRAEAGTAKSAVYAETVRDLFGLDPDVSSESHGSNGPTSCQ